MLAEARDADLWMTGLRAFPGKHNQLGPACICDAKEATNIVWIGPILGKKGHATPGSLVAAFLVLTTNVRFGSDRHHALFWSENGRLGILVVLEFRKKLRVILLLMLTLLPVVGAFAQSVVSKGASIYVNDVAVLTIRTSIGKTSAATRAAQAAANLKNAGGGAKYTVEGNKNEARVLGNGALIVRVTSAEAKKNRMTPLALASRWAASIRNAFDLPPLKVQVKAISLPSGGAKTLTVIGYRARGGYSVSSTNPDVAKAEVERGSVRIVAISRGNATITLKAGDISDSVDVAVLPYAAKLPQKLHASVVGQPASKECVRQAVIGAALNELQVEPGATIKLNSVYAEAINAGESKTCNVSVEVTAQNAFKAEGRVEIQVRNEGLSRLKETELWYCNDPENVTAPGRLFAAELVPNSPARMLYHHINASASPLVLQVWIKNPNNAPARIVIIPGDGDPSKDPVRAGLDAGERFFTSWLSGSGHIVTIPAKSAMPLVIHRLAPGQTSSGLTYLRLLDNERKPLIVRTDAIHPTVTTAAWMQGEGLPTPWIVTGTRRLADQEMTATETTEHVYPEPFLEMEANYEIGGRFAFFRIGQEPIASQNSQKELDGNFGVIYSLKSTVTNPTQVATTIEAVFEASAGYSGAVFTVDGVFVRTPLLQTKGEFVLKTITLQPGQSQSITIQTIPLSGSSYPATIVVRPKGIGIPR